MIDLFTLFAAAVLQAGVPAPPAVRTIDKGAMSELSAPRQIAVTDRDAWAALWKSHGAGRRLPDVDFSTEIVVGVFLGMRPTAGFAVDIVGCREAGGNLVVQYRETEPSRDDITAQVLTSPYHLAAIPRRAGTITFERLKN